MTYSIAIPGEGDGCPPTKAIRFFKIILSFHLVHGKLRIPKKFVKKYGECILDTDTVFLKPQSGKQWKVNLEKHDDGQVWFCKGWKEFAEFHSLEQGHLVIFKYAGPSLFKVLIFDTSALEIDYPLSSRERKKPREGKKPSKDQGFQVQKDEVSLECHEPSRKRKDHSPPTCCQPQKKRRAEQNHKVESTNKFQIMETQNGESIPCKSTSRFHKSMKGRPHKLRTENNVALERPSAFKSCNPWFKVEMCKSYIKSRMGLPMKFCKKYFDLRKKQGDIILRVSDGRFWLAQYVIRKANRFTMSELSGGWKQFKEGNNLKVGDVCIFELIERTKIIFMVHIYRNIDPPNCPLSQESIQFQGKSTSRFQKHKEGRSRRPRTASEKSGALEKASAFRSCNQFVQVVMHKSYIKRRLNLQTKFCKRYFDMRKKQGDIILRVPDGRFWPVQYIIRKLNGVTLTELAHGWKQFKEGNNLKVDDVCIFEFIDRTKITFLVHIYRNIDPPKCPLSQEFDQNVETKIKREYDAAINLNSEYPSFKSSVGYSYHKFVKVPFRFVKDYIKTDAKIVKLQVGTRSWPITLNRYAHSAFFSGGWLKFARQNGLEGGEDCFFELIDSDDTVMKVSILRNLSD